MCADDSGEGFCLSKLRLWHFSPFTRSSWTVLPEKLNAIVKIPVFSVWTNHSCSFTALTHQDQTRLKNNQWHCHHHILWLTFVQETEILLSPSLFWATFSSLSLSLFSIFFCPQNCIKEHLFCLNSVSLREGVEYSSLEVFGQWLDTHKMCQCQSHVFTFLLFF